MTYLTSKVAHITPVLMNLHWCPVKFKVEFKNITQFLMNLYWLPVKFRVEFKIALLVFKALHGIEPCYIRDLLSFKYESTYQLRSDDLSLLQVPKTNAKTLGDRTINMLPRQFGTCFLFQ